MLTQKAMTCLRSRLGADVLLDDRHDVRALAVPVAVIVDQRDQRFGEICNQLSSRAAHNNFNITPVLLQPPLTQHNHTLRLAQHSR
jgi:hypothetical protein